MGGQKDGTERKAVQELREGSMEGNCPLELCPYNLLRPMIIVYLAQEKLKGKKKKSLGLATCFSLPFSVTGRLFSDSESAMLQTRQRFQMFVEDDESITGPKSLIFCCLEVSKCLTLTVCMQCFLSYVLNNVSCRAERGRGRSVRRGDICLGIILDWRMCICLAHEDKETKSNRSVHGID